MKTHTIDKGYDFERAVVQWIADKIDESKEFKHSRLAVEVFGGSNAASNWRKIKQGDTWKDGKAGRMSLSSAYKFIVLLGEDPGAILNYISQQVKEWR
jgi:hypothetical protein